MFCHLLSPNLKDKSCILDGVALVGWHWNIKFIIDKEITKMDQVTTRIVLILIVVTNLRGFNIG